MKVDGGREGMKKLKAARVLRKLNGRVVVCVFCCLCVACCPWGGGLKRANRDNVILFYFVMSRRLRLNESCCSEVW